MVGFAFGFGIDTACTNNFNCTADSCPSRCDRVSIAVWLNTVAQFALIAWTGVLAVRRRQARRHAVVAAGVSVVVCGVAYLLASSWDSGP